MSLADDTIAALATPAGTAAIALLRVSGPRAGELNRGLGGADTPPRFARHGNYHDIDGNLIDDVLFTFFAAPNSYTGEDTLEISCHGSPFVAHRILEDLIRRGCRPAEPGEFTKRAFLAGRLDLSQAEAVMDLIHARSQRALDAANRQLRGSLRRLLDSLISRLADVLAGVEARIDFPDEDLPAEDLETTRQQLCRLADETGRLLATNHYGETLRSGVRTVLIGETNAGKSSLLNQLVGRERALVSPEPGTTRDYIEEETNLGPYLVRLVDTAGVNANPTELEQRGMVKTEEEAARADLFLWVIDSARPLPPWPPLRCDRLAPENTIAVLNKSDLPASKMEALPTAVSRISTSALTGAGVEELRSAIVQFAERCRRDQGDEAIAINARHAAALERARGGLESALRKLSASTAPELLASDLRDVLAAYGEILGKVDDELIMDRLFSTFCIGK